MYSRYKRIDRRLYDWFVKHKLVDAPLIAKWKKPGYERLCSTYVINPKNFNFGTTSICRVPRQKLASTGRVIVGNTTGCLGCASGPGGYTNIFGSKYGQNLADIQMCRERGRLRELGAWSEEEAEEAWLARGGGVGKKRSRLELLALEPNGEVWATEEEERAMLLAKRGLAEPEAAPDASADHAAGWTDGGAASAHGHPGGEMGAGPAAAPLAAAGPESGGQYGAGLPAASAAAASSAAPASSRPGTFGVYDGMTMGGYTAVLNAHTHNSGVADDDDEEAEGGEGEVEGEDGKGEVEGEDGEAGDGSAAASGKREREDEAVEDGEGGAKRSKVLAE